MDSTDAAHPGGTDGGRASDVLAALAMQGGDSITLGAMIDRLGDRAHGLALFILALPCCIPLLYGVPQLVSIPMVLVAGQLTWNPKRLWLPERLRARPIGADSLQQITRRTAKPLSWLEKVARPRLSFLVRGPAERLMGVLMLVFSLSISLPLPSTNTVPGIGVALMSLGLIERDGLLVLAGAIIGTLWIAVLILFGATVASLMLGILRGP